MFHSMRNAVSNKKKIKWPCIYQRVNYKGFDFFIIPLQLFLFRSFCLFFFFIYFSKFYFFHVLHFLYKQTKMTLQKNPIFSLVGCIMQPTSEKLGFFWECLNRYHLIH